MAKDKNGNYYYINKDDERYKSGILVGLTKGYHHSEETCKKMKESRQRLGCQKGEKNSQYGTCIIHNNIENKRIKKEELEKYLANGWIKGQKLCLYPNYKRNKN